MLKIFLGMQIPGNTVLSFFGEIFLLENISSTNSIFILNKYLIDFFSISVNVERLHSVHCIIIFHKKVMDEYT